MTDPIIWYVIGGVLAVGVISLYPTLQIVNRVAPFAYPNARLRARKNKHVTDEQFENLAGRPYADILATLEKTTYPNITANSGGEFNYARMDSALRANLIEELEWLKSISPGSTKTYINAILAKYDLQVIETILRAGGKPVRELLHNTKLFSKEFITRENVTIEALKNELKNTSYEGILANHADQIAKGNYEEVEIALDVHYFTQLKAAASTQEQRRHAKTLIDIHNIGLALKNKEPVIPGGRIPAQELSKDPYTAAKKAGYPEATEIKELERALQLDLKRYGKALLAKDPLSEASIIGYLILKTINVRNTAILLKMKYHDFSKQAILEVIV